MGQDFSKQADLNIDGLILGVRNLHKKFQNDQIFRSFMNKSFEVFKGTDEEFQRLIACLEEKKEMDRLFDELTKEMVVEEAKNVEIIFEMAKDSPGTVEKIFDSKSSLEKIIHVKTYKLEMELAQANKHIWSMMDHHKSEIFKMKKEFDEKSEIESNDAAVIKGLKEQLLEWTKKFIETENELEELRKKYKNENVEELKEEIALLLEELRNLQEKVKSKTGCCAHNEISESDETVQKLGEKFKEELKISEDDSQKLKMDLKESEKQLEQLQQEFYKQLKEKDERIKSLEARRVPVKLIRRVNLSNSETNAEKSPSESQEPIDILKREYKSLEDHAKTLTSSLMKTNYQTIQDKQRIKNMQEVHSGYIRRMEEAHKKEILKKEEMNRILKEDVKLFETKFYENLEELTEAKRKLEAGYHLKLEERSEDTHKKVLNEKSQQIKELLKTMNENIISVVRKEQEDAYFEVLCLKQQLNQKDQKIEELEARIDATTTTTTPHIDCTTIQKDVATTIKNLQDRIVELERRHNFETSTTTENTTTTPELDQLQHQLAEVEVSDSKKDSEEKVREEENDGNESSGSEDSWSTLNANEIE